MYCAAYDLAYDAIMMLRRDSEIAGGHHKGLAEFGYCATYRLSGGKRLGAGFDVTYCAAYYALRMILYDADHDVSGDGEW